MPAAALFLAAALAPIAEAVTPDPEESWLNRPGRMDLGLGVELGTVAPLYHTIQFSRDGTKFDYISEGGQDNLFFFSRLAADLDVGPRHSIVLLYQPLDIQTQALLERDVRIDEGVFAAGTALDLRYGFDFYRASWLYDLQPAPGRELGLGLSLQIRNAAIEFTSADGELRRVNHDIGPVPVIKLRARQPLGKGAWWGVEADGFYAPIKYLNGSDTDVVGAILDASARVGKTLDNGGEAFLNLRYLGGGATGTEKNHVGPGDG